LGCFHQLVVGGTLLRFGENPELHAQVHTTEAPAMAVNARGQGRRSFAERPR
jgi:hypothetical protein